jgi:hypothetical protein
MEQPQHKVSLEWWAYVHTTGTLQLKRYFGYKDLLEARESPFCKHVAGPFEADSREEAETIARNLLGKYMR